jgi:thioredoxin 1
MNLPFSKLSRYVSNRPLVVVDFFTPTCGPCQRMPPLLQALSKATGVEVVTVDISEDFGLAKSYGVSSVPTVVIFKHGQEVNRAIGVPSSARKLVSMVQPYLR